MSNWFTKKKERLLTMSDLEKLHEIERIAYFEEAKELARQRGVVKAKRDYQAQQEKAIW